MKTPDIFTRYAQLTARIAELESQVTAAQGRERAVVSLLELDHADDIGWSFHPVTRDTRQDIARVLNVQPASAERDLTE